VLSLLRASAREKYDLLLDQYPQLFQRVPKKMIAHYLGVSRETLSRLYTPEK
jgi:CRP-like cAMP-binding protein